MTNDELRQRIIAAVDPLNEGETAYRPEGVAIAVIDALMDDGYTISREDGSHWPQFPHRIDITVWPHLGSVSAHAHETEGGQDEPTALRPRA